MTGSLRSEITRLEDVLQKSEDQIREVNVVLEKL